MLKIIFFILVSFALMTPVAFAQEELAVGQKITLMTDKTAYGEGDVITIYGEVEKVIVGLEVSLQIFFGKNQGSVNNVAESITSALALPLLAQQR